jgi:hypothetical protein
VRRLLVFSLREVEHHELVIEPASDINTSRVPPLIGLP